MLYTSLMRLLLPILLLSWVLAGCGMDARPVAEAPEPVTQAKVINLPTETPGSTGTAIGLIHDTLTLQVGNTADEGRQIFPRPEKATLVSELPDGWPKDYSSSGWQTDKEGFGMILHDGKVVGALYSQEDVTNERVQLMVADYSKVYADSTKYKADEIPNKNPKIDYWIWEDDEYRCMVCETVNARSKLVVTVGMGYKQVMDALGMSKDAAADDIKRAENVLQNAQKG